jgi:type I restriction enzyme S subunit
MFKFDKLTDIAGVIDSLHKTPKYSESGRAMVRCTDIKYGNLDLKETFKVNEDVFAEFSRRYTPKEEDIIITRVGSYGITAIVRDTDFCLGQNISVIVPKGINARYLYLTLNSPFVKQQIEFSVVGAVQKTLSLKAINNLEIPRFEPEIEEKIAKIGGELDKKIELNRQTNQTLEHIAQAIFKSWFVDFEPTRAKIAAKKHWQALHQNIETSSPTCYSETFDTAKPSTQSLDQAMTQAAMAAISGKTPEELQQLSQEQKQHLQNIAALFPDALVDSESGETNSSGTNMEAGTGGPKGGGKDSRSIPEGWAVESLEDIIELAYGKSLKKEDRTAGGYPVYGSGGLTGTHNEALVDGPGIVVGRKGTVGSLYWEDKSFFPIDTVFYVKCKNGVSLSYSFYLLQTLGLENMNTDAAVPGLNRNNAYRLEITKAPSELRMQFTAIVDLIRKKILINNMEMGSLEKLRDSLLPKLLSGEINIGGAS